MSVTEIERNDEMEKSVPTKRRGRPAPKRIYIVVCALPDGTDEVSRFEDEQNALDHAAQSSTRGLPTELYEAVKIEYAITAVRVK
jgi:hypothetical protein